MKAIRIGAGLAAMATLGGGVLAPLSAGAQRGQNRDREERRDTRDRGQNDNRRSDDRRRDDRSNSNRNRDNWQDRLGGIFGQRDRGRTEDRSRRDDDRSRRDRDDTYSRDRRNDDRDRRDWRDADRRDNRNWDARDGFGDRYNGRDGRTDREADRRQQTKNEWRNIAIGAGLVGVVGLLKKDNTLFFGGSAGALYSLWRYEQDRKSQNSMDRARAEYFSRPYFVRDGRRYDRRTVSQNGQQYYRFECDD